MLTTTDNRYVSTGDTVYILFDGPQDAEVIDINRKGTAATVRISGGDYHGCEAELGADRIWAVKSTRDAWLRS